MTAAAHDPQIRQCFAERIGRPRIEPEYEPAARRECSMNALRRAEVWSLRRQRIDAPNDQARNLALGLEDDGVFVVPPRRAPGFSSGSIAWRKDAWIKAREAS
jgi:hypothetical protein